MIHWLRSFTNYSDERLIPFGTFEWWFMASGMTVGIVVAVVLLLLFVARNAH